MCKTLCRLHQVRYLRYHKLPLVATCGYFQYMASCQAATCVCICAYVASCQAATCVCVYERYLRKTSCTNLFQYVASTYIAVQELELPVSVHAHVPLLDVAFAGAARLHLRAHKHDACTRNTYGMRMYGLGTTYLHLHTSIPKPYILIPHSNVSSIW